MVHFWQLGATSHGHPFLAREARVEAARMMFHVSRLRSWLWLRNGEVYHEKKHTNKWTINKVSLTMFKHHKFDLHGVCWTKMEIQLAEHMDLTTRNIAPKSAWFNHRKTMGIYNHSEWGYLMTIVYHQLYERFRRCSSNGWVNSTSFCLQEVTSKFYPILSGNELNQIEWTEMVLTKHTLCICCTVITLAGFPECFPASSDGTKWAPPCISKSVLNKTKEGFMVDISIYHDNI